MHGVADPAPEDRSESDEVQAKLRKCSGKRSEEREIWNILAGPENWEGAPPALMDSRR